MLVAHVEIDELLEGHIGGIFLDNLRLRRGEGLLRADAEKLWYRDVKGFGNLWEKIDVGCAHAFNPSCYGCCRDSEELSECRFGHLRFIQEFGYVFGYASAWFGVFFHIEFTSMPSIPKKCR